LKITSRHDRAPQGGGSLSTQQAWREQWVMLATILDAVGVGVYVADMRSYELLFMNDYLERAFGPDWGGRRCYEVLQAGQEGPCTFCSNPRLVREGVAQPPHIWEFQNTVNGRWYMCIDRAITWTDGRLVRLEVAVDVTERKELERFREQYVGLVAHDLRGPSSNIALTADVLQRELAAGDGEAGILASRIRANARRMSLMLEDLVESVQLESPDFRLERAEVDLVTLTRGVVQLLSPLDQARVEMQALSRPLRVSGDEQRLQRVVDNLISNALKYGPPDKPCVVEFSDTADHATVSVRDQGDPIPAEHRPRLFDRFYRMPGTPGKGLGLGLYIARLIVERHGGRIGVASGPDEGNRFTVTLPSRR
jgi:two-component system, OmpR family, phosphate regulon sensor histidine kinase PhoR